MPRKAFIADVQSASEGQIAGISSVGRGEDDGDVNAIYIYASGTPIELGLLVTPDVSAYPSESTFMIFTRSSNVPQGVDGVLQDVAESSAGMTLPELLRSISHKLNRYLATGSQDNPYSLDELSDVEMMDGPDDEYDQNQGDDQDQDEDDTSEPDYPESDDDIFGARHGVAASSIIQQSPEATRMLNRLIREDLRTAKLAGFKVGILNGMKADSTNSLLSLSMQVRKLGLSDEAIQAWDLEPQQYIVLLIRFSSGYKTFEAVISEPAKSLDVEFRVGVSNKYKPAVMEALAAFTDMSKNTAQGSSEDSSEAVGQDSTSLAGFSSMFISSSLNDFINSEFVSLLKIRTSVGLGWDGAKRYFNDKQSRLDEQSADLPAKYYEESSPKETTIPISISIDHISEDDVKRISFPLVATQFVLRYLIRCTEFCLVCHDKIEEDFEALKPFVCDKPLCLYQYMSLGFGPSVEHEILTQPYVVDLLVSFCYASALGRGLREYPTGMSLAVPPIVSAPIYQYIQYPANTTAALQKAPDAAVPAPEPPKPIDVKLDAHRNELVFDSIKECPVRQGDWVVVNVIGRLSEHYRIEDISLFPTVRLSGTPITCVAAPGQGVSTPIVVPTTPATTPPPQALVPATMLIYNQNFDDMTQSNKAETIVMLLETLPSIMDLKAYLIQQSRRSEPNLRKWKERVSPAALGILRWIIASNRSCIVQVDKCPGQDENDTALSKVRLDQRVSNISQSWVQFRFAQGSPDKEQRFLNALRAQQGVLNPLYPTMFAFHGSPLQNWHSIIRTGLDFKQTLHGRAFGHGVYHAIDQSTSVGYAHQNSGVWQGSALKISSAMSLNEIVNCPTEFTSSTPYLVVQHIDWIQCRYLFVQVQGGTDTSNVGGNSDIVTVPVNVGVEVEQDPKYTAKSTLHMPIGIPLCAASTSSAFRGDNKPEIPEIKRRKQSWGTSTLSLADSAVSDSEETSDLIFLFTDDEEPTKQAGKSGDRSAILASSPKVAVPSQTDFIPGSLDQSTLPMLEPPSYATPMATKTLNRALKEMLSIQEKTPLHELGWYIDGELISNVYQWIVELHSFDPDLPLAKDMKQAGVTSVVLEIRFGKDYPFSPPFVRVIRPRFLPFTSGGGGHVTMGGAMCMELLTNTGWSSVSSLESVLLQVRLAMMNLDPRPARLEGQGQKQNSIDYGTGEAISAFIRACAQHGWQVPPDFNDFAGTGSSAY